MTIRPHVERGRWWTSETTRYRRVVLLRCETCNGGGFGQYGGGYRCHDCGRLVANVDEHGMLTDDTEVEDDD